MICIFDSFLFRLLSDSVGCRKGKGGAWYRHVFLRGSPVQGQWRLSWARPCPGAPGFPESAAGPDRRQEQPRAGRRDSGHGRPPPDVECALFGPRGEPNPAAASESKEKGRPRMHIGDTLRAKTLAHGPPGAQRQELMEFFLCSPAKQLIFDKNLPSRFRIGRLHE
jgi:hypothetical protein